MGGLQKNWRGNAMRGREIWDWYFLYINQGDNSTVNKAYSSVKTFRSQKFSKLYWDIGRFFPALIQLRLFSVLIL